MNSTRDIIIQVTDMDTAIAFYETVMGLKPFQQSPQLTGFETGNFRLFLEPGSAPAPVFEFAVPDLEEAKARLVDAGCAVVDDNPAIPRCYLRDPFGLTFNIARGG